MPSISSGGVGPAQVRSRYRPCFATPTSSPDGRASAAAATSRVLAISTWSRTNPLAVNHSVTGVDSTAPSPEAASMVGESWRDCSQNVMEVRSSSRQ